MLLPSSIHLDLDISRAENIPAKPASNDTALIELLQEILNQGASVRIKVTGKSMHPAIISGNIVTISKTDRQFLHRGDLIFYFTLDNHLILHRLIRLHLFKEPDYFQTKGDNQSYLDAPAPYSHILGKVISVEPNKRRWYSVRFFILTKTWTMLFLSSCIRKIQRIRCSSQKENK